APATAPKPMYKPVSSNCLIGDSRSCSGGQHQHNQLLHAAGDGRRLDIFVKAVRVAATGDANRHGRAALRQWDIGVGTAGFQTAAHADPVERGEGGFDQWVVGGDLPGGAVADDFDADVQV